MKKVRASKGERAIYVQHGVWYGPGTKNIHVTIPGAKTEPGAHWSYHPRDKQFAIYEQLLRGEGRWPIGA